MNQFQVLVSWLMRRICSPYDSLPAMVVFSFRYCWNAAGSWFGSGRLRLLIFVYCCFTLGFFGLRELQKELIEKRIDWKKSWELQKNESLCYVCLHLEQVRRRMQVYECQWIQWRRNKKLKRKTIYLSRQTGLCGIWQIWLYKNQITSKAGGYLQQ